MTTSRTELLQAIWENRVVRYGGTFVACVGTWDALSNQFGLPKIPQIWNATGAVLPMWAWLMMLLALLYVGLFEFVRLSITPTPSNGGQDLGDLIDEIEVREGDLSLAGLGNRIADSWGDRDRDNQFHRRVNLEIADKIQSRALSVWGRYADQPLARLTKYDLITTTLNYQRNSLQIPNVHGVDNYTDVRFVAAEVDQIWPPPNQEIDLS